MASKASTFTCKKLYGQRLPLMQATHHTAAQQCLRQVSNSPCAVDGPTTWTPKKYPLGYPKAPSDSIRGFHGCGSLLQGSCLRHIICTPGWLMWFRGKHCKLCVHLFLTRC